MKRFQAHMQNNPLPAWLLSCAFLLLLSLGPMWLLPVDRTNPAFVLLIIIIALSSPTRLLIDRFSKEQRRINPVPPRQEKAVGVLSLLAWACSVGAFVTVIFGRELGLRRPVEKEIWLLTLFSGSALLALTLGYAVRHTREGRRAIRLTIGWIVILIASPLVLIIGALLLGVLFPGR